jgi:molybdopterin synthase sulfur carrier subunit
MRINILAFGIVKVFFGRHSIELEVQKGLTVAGLKDKLEIVYPDMKRLGTYMIAVNDEYAEDDLVMHPEDEIAIIPPVSGG